MSIATQLSSDTDQTCLDALVDDVLIQILSLLPAWDVLHLRQTSKRMEALSHVSAVWRTLFSRDVLTCGRPIPGFSFAPTPRLVQLCSFDSNEDLSQADFQDIEKCDVARQLIEASDLETRTLHALRLDKTWSTSASATTTSTPRLDAGRTFQTPSPVRDIVLLPGGRFVVSLHADRLRCWDLGVPRALNSSNTHTSSVKCAGEVVLSRGLSEATMCMDTRPTLPSISVYGRHSVFNISFALCPDFSPSWQDSASSEGDHRRRTCEILSVCLDPVRSSSASELHGSASRSASATGSPFSSPVPFFRHEGIIRLPELLITPSYPEGSVSAQTMVGPQWGPQRFARGKLGRMLLLYELNLFFESFVPPAPADGNEERNPRYAGIEVLDLNEPTNSVLFEYPDPQVGSYVGMHVYASANQVLVVWQNCAGLYPLPFRQSALSSSSSSLSLSGSAAPTSAPPSRPSTPFHITAASKFSRPDASFSSSSSPLLLSSSPGSSRSSIYGAVLDSHEAQAGTLVDEDVKIENVGPDTDANYHSEPEPRRTVMMPTITFALREPVEAPIAFSLCSGSEIQEKLANNGSEEAPHPLTILARSRTHPTRNVQSVLTATPNPYPENGDEKFTFRLSRIPIPTTVRSELPSDNVDTIAALSLGRSGRGVRANAGGNLFRCSRVEVVLPRAGFGFGYGLSEAASAVPTVDFWPWKCAAVLPTAGASSTPLENDIIEREKLVLRFDDGMGRVVAARVPQTASPVRQGTSEITILDFV